MLAVCSIAVAFAMLEGAARYFYEDLAPEGGRKVIKRALSSDIAKTDWLYYKSHPYMLYMLAPNERDTNSRGYRGPEFTDAPPSDRLRILALGGSTTWGQGAKTYDQAWPGQLEAILARRGLRTEVINGAFPAATTAELAAHYVFKHKAYKPDIVILHVGWNDTLPLLSKHYHAAYDDYRGWKSPPLAFRPGEKHLLSFAIMRIAYAWWFQHTALDEFIIVNDRYRKFDPAQALKSAKENFPEGFSRNVETIIDLARAHGARVILFPTTVAWDTAIFERSPAPNSERVWPALMVSLEKNRAVLREISKRKSVMHFELLDRSIPLREFIDHAHTTPQGHAIKARFIADKMCAMLKEARLRHEFRCSKSL